MADRLTLRRAAAEDVPALRDLVESAYRGESARSGWTHEADLLDGQRSDREGLAATIASPDQTILLAFLDEQLVGCVQVSRAGPHRCALGLLAVDPKVQQGGLGKRLIAAAEEEAQARFSASEMEMTVIRQRSELIAYYERRGYRRSGEERPFPVHDHRFGIARVPDLAFVVLIKALAGLPGTAPQAGS